MKNVEIHFLLCNSLNFTIEGNLIYSKAFIQHLNSKKLLSLWTQAVQEPSQIDNLVLSELKHRRPKLITWTRTWLLLVSGVMLQTVIYKGLYGIDRFFLKEIKNVMFLNKIDVPYCLVVFFVVCPRLRPFWSVFGELALFWCPTAKRKTPGVGSCCFVVILL